MDDNKTELFSFLTHQVTILKREGKAVYATDGHDVLCSMAQIDLTGLAPWSHEEAESRLFQHVADAVMKSYSKLLVRTVDTDVVVVTIATLNRTKPDEFVGGVWYWWAFPVHSNPRSSCSRRSEEICYSPPVRRTYRVRHRVFNCRYRNEDRMVSLECLPRSHRSI